jgi:hypothetical protein
VGDGSGAHRTGFDRDVHIAVGQTVIADDVASLAQSLDLGMGGGVVVSNGAIASASDNMAFTNNNRSDGNFAERQRALGLT